MQKKKLFTYTIYPLGLTNIDCHYETYFQKIKIMQTGDGEMTLWLRVFAAIAKDVGSVPITHVVAHNHL